MRQPKRPKIRYTVWLHKWDRADRSYSLAAEYKCGTSLSAARRTAASLLAPVEVTRWGHRDYTDFADIKRTIGPRLPRGMTRLRTVESVNQEETLVPSVGELGWTP